MAGDKKQTETGAFAYEGLDRVIHERARLAILSSLASHEHGLSFNDLKDLCALTDGNLSRQLQAQLANHSQPEVAKLNVAPGVRRHVVGDHHPLAGRYGKRRVGKIVLHPGRRLVVETERP